MVLYAQCLWRWEASASSIIVQNRRGSRWTQKECTKNHSPCPSANANCEKVNSRGNQWRGGHNTEKKSRVYIVYWEEQKRNNVATVWLYNQSLCPQVPRNKSLNPCMNGSLFAEKPTTERAFILRSRYHQLSMDNSLNGKVKKKKIPAKIQSSIASFSLNIFVNSFIISFFSFKWGILKAERGRAVYTFFPISKSSQISKNILLLL